MSVRTLLPPLALICPRCRRPDPRTPRHIALQVVEEPDERGDAILGCPAADCGARYPMIGGIPLVVRDCEAVFGHQGPVILARFAWGPADLLVRGWLPPDHPLRLAQATLGAAVATSWAERLRPAERPLPDGPLNGAAFDAWLAACIPPNARLGADLGVGVGRGAHVLAQTGCTVVALDLLYAPLAFVAALRRPQPFAVPVPLSGAAVRLVDFEPPAPAAAARIFPVLADVCEPPLPAEAFDIVLLLNVLDNARDPLLCLGQADALLKPGGRLVVTCPHAYQPHITPEERWLAGSPRLAGPVRAPEDVLVAALTGRHPYLAHLAYDIREERRGVPWTVVRDERCRIVYDTQVIVADKRAAPAGPPG